MFANLTIDDSLIKEACQLSDQLAANEVATLALQEYIQQRKQLKLLDFFGIVEYGDDYDYRVYRKVTNADVSV
jgi:hypothetical protein